MPGPGRLIPPVRELVIDCYVAHRGVPSMRSARPGADEGLGQGCAAEYATESGLVSRPYGGGCSPEVHARSRSWRDSAWKEVDAPV